MKSFALASVAVAAALLAGCAQTPPVAETSQQSSAQTPSSAPGSAPATQAPTLQPTVPATKPAAALTTVSILSDSHAYIQDSWWRQTVVANKVPGLTVGAFESHPGFTTADLLSYLDAAASKKGKVIVQAGTNDLLLRGSTPAAAAAGVEKLWQGLRDRGAVPVAALVPPANARPAEAVQLNALIRQAAEAQNITVIDVYTPVANKDGSWAAGLTDDGIHSNKAGSDLMAAAAMKQLASLAD